MAEDEHDNQDITKKRNMARYFVESPQVAWIFLIFTMLFGVFGYLGMDKRRDPLNPNIYCVAVCPWPGASAQEIEQLITRKIESKVSENMKVMVISSVSRSNVSIITIQLDERLEDTEPQFDDIKIRLDSIRDLPNGAGPITFLKDYGEVTTLMLTVASPKESPVELSLRAKEVEGAIRQVRPRAPPSPNDNHVSIVACFPQSVGLTVPRRQRDLFVQYAGKSKLLQNLNVFDGNGFIGIDATTSASDADIQAFIQSFAQDKLKYSLLHPDLWEPAIIRDPSTTEAMLTAVAGEKYSYRELEQYTDLIERTLQTLPEVTRINRSGILDERITLAYSQDRLGAYGLTPINLQERLPAQNTTMPGGVIEIDGRNVPLHPSGQFKNEKDIGNVAVAASGDGAPVYLRNLVDISRDYNLPPRYLNFFTWRDKDGKWQRTRAITMSVYMRTEEHIDQFGAAVEKGLAALRQQLPDDLIITRTSDQPQQVEENVDLFMTSLYEAIILVVVTALIGFWEWRSALLVALSIPTTLAMTFGMMYFVGIDVQQVSIASLIIALGLLVDDPVVAGDAIKKELSEGKPRALAAWLGPTRLAHAIMFATITNIAAYLPLLMLSGQVGQYIRTLPIVITLSLVASRIVSMTFVPMLGYYLLRFTPKAESVDGWKARAKAKYFEWGNIILAKRVPVFSAAVALLVIGAFCLSKIQTAYFPKDLQYLCWVDVWLPEDATLVTTDAAAQHAETIVKEAAAQYGAKHGKDGKPKQVLDSLSTFVGGSGPRFWASILPELDQLNYAQVILKLNDKHDTSEFIPFLQHELSVGLPEALCDVRELETGKPVGIPVQLRVTGYDIDTIRKIGAKVVALFRSCPMVERVRDDWGADTMAANLQINSDKASLVGLTNVDIAGAVLSAVTGYQVDVLREGDKEIPIVARMRTEESAQVQDLSNIYVYSHRGPVKVPLNELANISYSMRPEKIRRRNQFRTMTVSCSPIGDHLPSEIMATLEPQLDALRKTIPPGYKIQIAGEQEEEGKSFLELATVMAVSIGGIFLCLVVQFKNAIKPLLVFAGLPFGLVGALMALTIMHTPFGFPAFMGVASLAGIIVSHVIVLFDIIEEKREAGETLNEALLDGAMARARPVLITVAATVLGLFPLALHGGPLWEPLCYAQIGGLTLATINTLLLVPILYSICVLDLKVIKWIPGKEEQNNP